MNALTSTRLITAALKSGDRETARAEFLSFAQTRPDDLGDLVFALGNARHVPPTGTVYIGRAWVLFSNPLRDDWVWRCGTHHPCVGVMYSTERAARRAAEKHATETGAMVRGVSR